MPKHKGNHSCISQLRSTGILAFRTDFYTYFALKRRNVLMQWGFPPNSYPMSHTPPQVIPLSNSTASVYYRKGVLDSFLRNDNGCDETGLVNGEEVLILNGDFREEILQLICGVRFPLPIVRQWFITKEKEWGSSWSANSSTNNWLNSR